MQIEEVKHLIEQGIPDCQVQINGDGSHFEALVVSAAFQGKTTVQRHQVVYRSLGETVGTVIHALSMQTYTPEEWEQKKEFRVL